MVNAKVVVALGSMLTIIGLLTTLFVLTTISVDVTEELQAAQATSGSVVNESERVVLNATLSTANSRFLNGTFVALATNHSAGAVVTNTTLLLTLGDVGVGNYTVDNLLGQFVVHSLGFSGSELLLNYSYETYNTAFNISQDGLAGYDNMSGFFPNIGLVIAATIMIVLLIAGFMVFANRF
jgi:hypothetical protein